ncbi:MAG: hypothetical protein IPK46_07310 [Saprospiraceae bacterium]|nr:hypothetical protein [Saprospiraceae bacterium]
MATQIENTEDTPVYMELMLHGLAETQVIGKSQSNAQTDFSDPLSRLLNFDDED